MNRGGVQGAKRSVVRALASRGLGRHELAHAIAPEPPAPGRARLNGLCRPDYWGDPEWRGFGRALALPQDEGWYHRKAWEWTQCVYGLERLGALGPDKLALGVGAGHERVLYYLANRARAAVATDLYGGDFAGGEAQEATPDFLRDPAHFAPFAFARQRLLAMPADGLALPFRTGTFDAVYSLSSIEHFGGHAQAAGAVREMCRVLRPGGVACVATELVLVGGPHEAYFTWEEFDRYVVKAAGLVLVEPLDTTLPPPEMLEEPVRLPEQVSRAPHVVVQEGSTVFTSVCAFLRKPTDAELLAQAARRAGGRARSAGGLVRRR
ncbi:MAG TPA: class I SAM-dependent methyltransferase [Acidimicrobiales bacterium]|nr:class I SAM-dependent methyltransferase [Acidimicrobiales bacterium]